MRRIQLNSVQLNAVRLNGIGECQRVSHAGAPPVVPDVPDIPDIPEEPDVDENGYIIFADPEVARICATNWGDGVGITEAQVASVTSLGGKFRNNAVITEFDELEKFSSLTAIGTSNDSYYNGDFINCTSLQSIRLPRSVTTLRRGAFRMCTNLGKIEGLDNIAEIQMQAFAYCGGLKQRLSLPNLQNLATSTFYDSGIEEIYAPLLKRTGSIPDNFNYGTFSNCANLKKAYFPSLVTLGANTFSKSSSLEWFIVASGVTAIEYRAFYRNSAISTLIVLPTTPPELGGEVFSSTPIASGTGSIYVPDASVSAYREATNWNTYASRIFPISQLPSNNPDLYNEIKDYL